MVKLRNSGIMHELRRQGLSISVIAGQTGLNRKTVQARSPALLCRQRYDIPVHWFGLGL